MRETFPEVLQFMRSRRSSPAKAMSAPGPSPEELADLVAIAARVPDHGKIAPWRFVHYSPRRCVELGQAFLARALANDPALPEEMRQAELTRFTRAPAVVGVVSAPRPHPKVPEWEQMLSAGAACYGLLIAANAAGWDAQWLTEWIAYDPALAGELGVGPGERIAGFVFMGTRTMPKSERDRPALADIFRTQD